MATESSIAAARAAGFKVHQGSSDAGELAGRWWWTLTREVWSGIECSEGDFATEAEAWDSAIITHVEELLEP